MELSRYTRLYNCLVIRDIITGKNKKNICKKYKIETGDVQAFISKTTMFASKIAQLAKTLNWWSAYNLLISARDKMMLDIPEELEELMGLGMLELFEARVLFEEGYTTIRLIAHAKPLAIYNILQTCSHTELYEASETPPLPTKSMEDVEMIIRKSKTIHMRRVKLMRNKQINGQNFNSKM